MRYAVRRGRGQRSDTQDRIAAAPESFNRGSTDYAPAQTTNSDNMQISREHRSNDGNKNNINAIK